MKIWLKSFLSTEGAKMRDMTFKQKAQYIWEYYKLHIILTLVIVVMVLSFALNRREDDFLYVAWFGPSAPQFQLSELGGMLSVITYEGEGSIPVSSYRLTGDPQTDMALQYRFFAMLQAGLIDVAIADSEELMRLASMGVVVPIQNIIDAAYDRGPVLQSKLSRRATSFTFPVSAEEDAEYHTEYVGISLAGSQVLADVGFNTDDLYFAIIFNARNLYRILSALEVLLI